MSEPFATLPDFIRPGLDVVFVGINPGAYSASVGRYFATPQNRFWSALTRSGLVQGGRSLAPGDEAWLIDEGIGFTDVVKRASNSASSLRAGDFREWAPRALELLRANAPLVVCFNGLTGYRWFRQYTDGARVKPELGRQADAIGESHVFVAPNPSPANAAFSLDVIAGWYAELRRWVEELKGA